MNRVRATSGAIPADPILTGLTVKPSNPATSNPFAVFQAVYSGGSDGVRINVTCGAAINAATIKLKRGFTKDIKQAKTITSWSGPFNVQEQLEYNDTSSGVLTATKAYYFSEIVYDQKPSPIIQIIGPQTAFIQATAGGSEQIPAFSYSISPDGGALDVCVSYQLPNSSDFGYADVYLTGYNSIQAPQLVAQGSTSPFTFTLVPTGETVTMQVNAVTVSGVPIANGTTQQIHLTSTATLPAIIYNGTAISNTVGNQITFPGSIESDVTQMKVYRQNAGGSFSGSTLIATISPSPEKSYTVTDNVTSPQNYIYFITAVNQVGESQPSPAIIPGQANSNASRGSGATAAVYMVTTTVPGIGNGLTFVAAAPITAQGNNYYAQPLVTFSASTASGGRTAQGTAILDGAGHVTFVQITDGGVYSSDDIDSATCTIHY
jgi:hypothetical protein